MQSRFWACFVFLGFRSAFIEMLVTALKSGHCSVFILFAYMVSGICPFCLDFQMCWRNAHHAPSPFTAPSVCSCVLLFFSYCSLVLSFFLVRRAPGLPVSYVFLQKPTCALLIFPIALLYPFSVSLISAFIFCYFLYSYFLFFFIWV